jgi:hypothetical protein
VIPEARFFHVDGGRAVVLLTRRFSGLQQVTELARIDH